MGLPIVSQILGLGEKLIDKLIPDPKQKAEALQKLAELEQSGELTMIAGQVEINKIEASSDDKFQRRWRPALGWVCVFGFGVQVVIGPMITWGTALAGHPITVPVMDVSLLGTMLVGMLGLGTMRSYDKLKVRK